MSAPLDDIRVIEIDNWMAAPSAGAMLADLGAEVIKIEPLSGDPMRDKSRPPKVDNEAMKDYDFQFDVDNRGKRSIAVALDTPEGADLVRRLVRTADVFLCNLLAERQQRFGLDPESLLAENPKIVHATLTGYGTTGPEAARPGYDVTAFFGRSGIYDGMREGDDGEVPMARTASGDHTTGIALVGAVLAALRLAERSGEGQVVETSLYETAVWIQASDYSVTAVDQAPLRRRDRFAQIIATANRFPCGDGRWLVMNMPEESAWPRLCKAIGLEDLLTEERFATMRDRYRNMPEIVAAIDGALSAKTRDEWGEIFDEHGLIWGPVLSLDEVARDPQAEAIGMWPTITHPDFGEYRSVKIPMRFHTADVGPKGPSPKIGEHTKAVLESAGLSAAEIDALIADGAVAQAE